VCERANHVDLRGAECECECACECDCACECECACECNAWASSMSVSVRYACECERKRETVGVCERITLTEDVSGVSVSASVSMMYVCEV